MKQYNEEQLNNLRQSGKILAQALEYVRNSIKPGVTTLQLDKIAEDFIRKSGGEPCFKGYQGYDFTICASVNEESIHGKPRKDKVLREGDIISVDCGVRFGGMCTDAARTFPVGQISAKAKELIDITEQCFFVATKGLKAGHRIASIGEKIEDFIMQHAKNGGAQYSIIDNYFGHGIGEEVHEEPLIPNYRITASHKKERLREIIRGRLTEGAVICIEPMINAGVKDVKTAKDGWTVVTADGELAAHYENTVIILKDGIEVVTL